METKIVIAQLSDVSPAQEQADQTLAVVQHMAVTNDDEQAAANAWLVDVKEESKKLEARRKFLVGPLNAHVKSINDLFRGPIASLTSVESALKGLIGQYQIEQKAAHKAALAAAATALVEGDDVTGRREIEKAEAHRTAAPFGTHVKEAWMAEITDANAVPREWCVPDEKRIAAIARSYPADRKPDPIPGVKFAKIPRVTVG